VMFSPSTDQNLPLLPRRVSKFVNDQSLNHHSDVIGLFSLAMNANF